MREAKASRGKALAEPICVGSSGSDNFILLVVSMKSTGGANVTGDFPDVALQVDSSTPF